MKIDENKNVTNVMGYAVFTGKYFKICDPSMSNQVTYFSCLSSGSDYDLITLNGYGFTIEEYVLGFNEKYLSLFDVDLNLQIEFYSDNKHIKIQEISQSDFDSKFLEFNGKIVKQFINHNNKKDNFLNILNGDNTNE